MKKIVWLTGALLLTGLSTAAHANQPYCREYTKQVSVGGRVQEGYGTACMQPDGSWAVSDEQTQPDPNIQLAGGYYGTYSFNNGPIYAAPPPVYYPPAPQYYPPRPYTSNLVLGFNFSDDDRYWRGGRDGWDRHRRRGHGWDRGGHHHGRGYGHH